MIRTSPFRAALAATLALALAACASHSGVHDDAPPPPNQDPVAAATSACLLLDCEFEGAGSTDTDGTITGFAWDFGDGGQGSGVSLSHAFAAPGTYQVTLTVTDDEGAQDSAQIPV